jgi:hypothetical protein
MLSRSGKLIPLFSLTCVMVICLYAKYMLMTYYLVLLTKSLVRSLAGDDAKVQDVYDGRAYILSRIPSKTTQGQHLHLPNEVYIRSSQEVWDEGRKAHQDIYGNKQTLVPQRGR